MAGQESETKRNNSIEKSSPPTLRRGYTTGTCAQAATRAAMALLLGGREEKEVTVRLPAGEKLTIAVEEAEILKREKDGRISAASCAVRKDSGDDPDVTNNVLVYSKVYRKDTAGVDIDGGKGIGRVTKPGLAQPVGTAAINPVPRRMIAGEVQEACEHFAYDGGIKVVIEIPEGEALAAKTFNPRIGVAGGISVLGTSGIVEPMSEQALLDTIEVEVKVKLADQGGYILAAPGNYGLDFLKQQWDISTEEVVKCSNYVGDTIEFAKEQGAKGLLFIAHIGKFIKVSGGLMNTHSKWGDCRMELLAAAALREGLDGAAAGRLLNCNTTEDALETLSESERQRVMKAVLLKIQEHLRYRAGEDMEIGAAVFSSVYGLLGMTESAEYLLRAFQKQKNEKNQK